MAGLTGLAVAAAVWLAVLLGYRLLARLAAGGRLQLDQDLLQTVRTPLVALGFLFGAELGLAALDGIEVLALPTRFLREALYLGRVFVLFLLLMRVVQRVADWYQRQIAPRTESTLDEQLLPFLRRVANLVLLVSFFVVILQHYEQPIGPLLASVGVASLAVALAARSTLEDLIAGIILMVDRPFRIGDRVELVDMSLLGDVADIGLRSTRIRTRDNRLIIVPNANIANNLVVNLTYPDPTLRLEVEVGVHYDSDIDRVRQVMVEAMGGCQGVLHVPEPQALFWGFGDSALLIHGRYWISSYLDWRHVQDRVNAAVLKAFRHAGIEIPFPMRTLTLGREERRLLRGPVPAPSPEGQGAPATSDDSRE